MPQEITQPTDEQIRTRAYYLWEADGRPQGRDWEYWIKAKEEMTQRDGTSNATALTASRKTPVSAPETAKKRNSRQAVLA